ncbi:R3H domain-containing protein [Aspergillus sp. HF37]|nr:R3H domain-containing protein [Aspergillus sp. HF37]
MAQRSHRFQPAKPSLRAFAHSLAADWGFATESFDPEPHRHVFVLKPTSWTPPLFGMGTPPTIGIGGMSVGECVKIRERHRMKELEAQRIAVAEAKAMREAARAQANGTSDGGWAQVASRRGNGGASSAAGATPAQSSSPLSGSMFAALAPEEGPKKERLVLRSGMGTGKQLQNRPAKVADSWEEVEEKEEQDEQGEQGHEQSRERDQQQKQPEQEEAAITA